MSAKRDRYWAGIGAVRTPIRELKADEAICPRCGRQRRVRSDRASHKGLCIDCKDVLKDTPTLLEEWK